MARKGSHQRLHRRRSIKGKSFKAGRGTTHKQFTHGDFDQDRTKNIDDTYPFDSTRRKPLDRDSRLTSEINTMNDFRMKHLKAMVQTRNKVREELEPNPKVQVVSRLKSYPSIVNKMNRKYLPKVRDVAGIMIEAQNKEELEKAVAKVKKMENLNVVKTEDFYDASNPRPYYKAIHFDVMHKNKPAELQAKTIRQRILHDRMHTGHKTGRDTGKLTRKQAITKAELFDKRDRTPPASKRKLKFLPNLEDDSGSQDYQTRQLKGGE